MTNVDGLKTTIKLRYDELDEWVAQNPIPDPGEVCVVVIPINSPNQYDPTIGQYYKENKLFSYSIGFKVGDGRNSFNTLPWIQAAAGDVYSWAKQSEPPNAGQLNATYNNQTITIQAVINNLVNILSNLPASNVTVTYNNDDNSDVQTAITGIENSLGNIVTQGVDPATLGNALAQLQEQLSGQTATIFNANQSGTIYKIDTLEQNGLNITTTSSPLTVSDISDLSFNIQYNQNTNPAATMGDLTALRADIFNNLPEGMHFRGISTTEITDGGTENPTVNNIELTSIIDGDVILYNHKEFIWVNNAWQVIGTEGNYVVSGEISNNDIANDAAIAQSKINGLEDALSNTIVGIQVPNQANYRDLNPIAKKIRLANIAETGSIYDVIEHNTIEENNTSINYLIFDCGDASHLITNPPMT